MNILCLYEENQTVTAFQAMAGVLGAEAEVQPFMKFGSSQNATETALRIGEYLTDNNYISVIAVHTPYSQRILSLLAAMQDVPFIGSLQVQYLPKAVRHICANRIVETIQIPTGPFCATIIPSEQAPVQGHWTISGTSHTNPRIAIPEMTFESFQNELIQLDSARIVFAGGRGLGSREYFEKLSACAKRCGAGLAASRLAVDMGWARNDMQVGQTGRAISPDIYVAFGISGAIQHLAGIQNAKRIIAINTDKTAPIFAHADTGIVADARGIIDKLAISN
ncbi:MAG: electron transfer flavoprotein subunit alpha/FixB family protein [Proteobacteria bacterium]|nr:electron transfer flavoprotein subunit alpha/FixB family protein [Pseudomonadota bacterium]